MLDREEFVNKIDRILEESKDATLAIVFILQESVVEQQLSKDEEEKLILEGWQRFLESFSLPCNCFRLGWCTYLILLEEGNEEIVSSFKKVFKIWELGDYPNIWRIAFTNVKDSKNRTRRMIGDFQEIAENAVRYYYPSERFFQIDVNEQRATHIFLN